MAREIKTAQKQGLWQVFSLNGGTVGMFGRRNCFTLKFQGHSYKLTVSNTGVLLSQGGLWMYMKLQLLKKTPPQSQGCPSPLRDQDGKSGWSEGEFSQHQSLLQSQIKQKVRYADVSCRWNKIQRGHGPSALTKHDSKSLWSTSLECCLAVGSANGNKKNSSLH